MSRIDDAIERSSLGTTKARAKRRTVPLASASRIVAAASTVKTTGRWGKASPPAPMSGRGRSNQT